MSVVKDQGFIDSVLAMRARCIPQIQISAELGISESSVKRIIRKWKESQKDTTPEFNDVIGVSTYYPRTEDEPARWVKTKTDKKDMQDFVSAAIEGFKGKIEHEPPQEFKNPVNSELLTLYPITDYHYGMMAWAGETGADWDLKIAEAVLVNWFCQAVDSAPDSKQAIFANMGDFIHFDSLLPITPANKHVLDAAGRLPQVVNSIVRVMRYIIRLLLDKHENVHIIWAEGNHDESTSVLMRALFAEKYMDEPRVTVDNSHIPYYAYEFGQNSIFVHHGHKRSVANLTETLVANFREMIGRTKNSYAHTGHRHHKHIKENAIIEIEQHQTLSAPDSHCTRAGFKSKRRANVITYHKEHGEIARATIAPEIAIDFDLYN